MIDKKQTLQLVFYKPFPIVILAVDAGKKWGATIMDKGVYKSIPNRSDAWLGELSNWIKYAYDIAAYNRRRFVVVAEKWSSHGKWGNQAIAGLNAEWGKWLREIERLPPRRPATRIVRVAPQTWRSKVLWGYLPHIKRDTLKRMAIAQVKMAYHLDVDDDRAEAILIAEWASRAPEVAKKLTRKELTGLNQ
jgi:hypothetical protein